MSVFEAVTLFRCQAPIKVGIRSNLRGRIVVLLLEFRRGSLSFQLGHDSQGHLGDYSLPIRRMLPQVHETYAGVQVQLDRDRFYHLTLVGFQVM